MTVEIISWSISTKVRDRVGIQSHDPWIQTHICCQTRYPLRKRSYWIQPNLFGDLLAQVGEQEHYCFLLFGSPLHGPQRVCIFWLNCSLFLNCWVELNQICAQLKQIVYTRAYFWVPHSEAPYNGDKSVCPFFFYANPNMLGWIKPNLLKGRLSHKWGVVKNIYFFNLTAKFSIIRNYWVIRRLRTVLTFFSIIYCNKTTYYSNFDYPKNSIFRSDLSVPIKEMAIKLPFKIRSPNVTHDVHDFFVWSSLFLLYRLIIRKK